MRQFTKERKQQEFLVFFKRHKKAVISTLLIVALLVTAVLVLFSMLGKKSFSSSFMVKNDVIEIGIRSGVNGFGISDENGELTGFDKELMDALLVEILGENDKIITYKPTTSQDSGGQIKYGTIDMAMGLLCDGVDKTKGFLLTQPYYTDDVVAVVSADSRLSGLSGLSSGKVGVLSTAIAAADFSDYVEKNGLSCEVLRYTDFESAREDISKGNINAVILPKTLAKDFEAEGFRVLPDKLYQVGYCVMLPTNAKAVKAEFDAAISRLQSNGTVDALKAKWGV